MARTTRDTALPRPAAADRRRQVLDQLVGEAVSELMARPLGLSGMLGALGNDGLEQLTAAVLADDARQARTVDRATRTA